MNNFQPPLDLLKSELEQRLQFLQSKMEQRLQLLESKFQHIDKFLKGWVPKVNEKLGMGPPVQARADADPTCNSYLNQLQFLAEIEANSTCDGSPNPIGRNTNREPGFQTIKIF